MCVYVFLCVCVCVCVVPGTRVFVMPSVAVAGSVTRLLRGQVRGAEGDWSPSGAVESLLSTPHTHMWTRSMTVNIRYLFTAEVSVQPWFPSQCFPI